MSGLRVGIAGYGLAGRVFHAPLVAATEGLEVAAIVTSDPERSAAAARDHPGARVVPSVDELLALDLDVVVVASPNRSHVPVALRAVERGLPVVVDKPLAVTVADAERLLAAGGGVTVFQNRRWDGDFLTARRLASSGELGKVVRFVSRFDRFRPAVGEGWRELGDAAVGGGQLLDLGSHLVDQALVLFGPVERVYAEVDARRPGARVDDDVFVALEHASGVRSHLAAGAVAPLGGPRLALTGLEGGFEVHGLDPQEEQLRRGMRPGDPGFGERAAPARLVDRTGTAREVEVERGDYAAFYAGVRDWVRGDGPPPVDPRDGVAALRVLEAARRSAASGTVVAVAAPARAGGGGRVREAGPADAPVVARLLHDFNVEFDTPTPGPEVLAARLERMLARDDALALLAGDPAVAVALMTFRPAVWDGGPVALLEELYVQPDLRGRGIGHDVLELAMALARDRGARTFEINVDEDDTGARRFYEAHGFANTDPGRTDRLLYYHRAL